MVTYNCEKVELWKKIVVWLFPCTSLNKTVTLARALYSFKKASFSGFSMTKGEQGGQNPALNECTEDIKGIRRQRNEG